MAAAARTPFESARRVFVIESVDAMNDQAANRMLKTLEEPPRVHASAAAGGSPRGRAGDDRLALPAGALRPAAAGADRGRAWRAWRASARAACARLALRRRGAGARGWRARRAWRCARARRSSCARRSRARRAGVPGLALLEAAKAAGAAAGEQAQERLSSELELVPSKERKRYEREGLEARRRGERRTRTRTLDLALRLAELWLRDVLCVGEGAPELVYAVDRRAELGARRRRAPTRARAASGDRAGGRHAPEPVAERRRRSSRWRRSPTACKRCWRLGRRACAGHRARSARSAPRFGSMPKVSKRDELREQAVLGAVEVGGAGGEQARARRSASASSSVCSRVWVM